MTTPKKKETPKVNPSPEEIKASFEHVKRHCIITPFMGNEVDRNNLFGALMNIEAGLFPKSEK